MRPGTLIALLLAILIAGFIGCSSNEPPTAPHPPTGGGGGDDDDDDNPPLDTQPPLPVTELRVFYLAESRVATLRWTAPQDDTPEEPVTRYEIRYTHTRGYYPPQFWELAIPVTDPPTPAAPGAEQAYEFYNPDRARDFWVGIRSVDEANHRSAPSDLVWTKIPGLEITGVLTDALTREPISGLAVQVSDVSIYHTTTDVNGRYAVADLSPGTINIRIQTGSAAELYHEINTSVVVSDDGVIDFVGIPFRVPQSPSLAGTNMLQVLRFITLTAGGNPILAKWRILPVPMYIADLVNEFGQDYRAAAIDAANAWMTATGIQLFEIVEAPPTVGITITYRSPENLEPLIGVTHRTNDGERHPVRDDILVANHLQANAVLYRVMLHEIGHTIRFDHFNTTGFIMYGGQPLPNQISPDEIDLVILHNAMPTRIDMSIYNDATPTR